MIILEVYLTEIQIYKQNIFLLIKENTMGSNIYFENMLGNIYSTLL